jgi:hypothetical protein
MRVRQFVALIVEDRHPKLQLIALKETELFSCAFGNGKSNTTGGA